MSRLITPFVITIVSFALYSADQARVSAQDTSGLADQIRDAVNQGGGNGGVASDTGGTTGLTTGGTTGSTTSAADNTTGGGTTGGSSGDAGGLLDPVEALPEIEPPALPNERDAPFVGLTVVGEQPEGKEFRHIGVTSESLGITGGGAGSAGRSGAAGGFRPAAGGAGPGGPQNGFRVIRPQSIRSRIVPRFSSRPLVPAYVSSRVNQRLSTLPTTQRFSNSINVSMRGRVAVITGTAQNQQQIDRIRRQLRLEPGVSRIVNQARVTN